MLSPDQNFLDAIADGSVKVAELFSIALSNGTTHYYTNHDVDVVWGSPSVTYLSVPINRDPISAKMNLEADSMTVSIQNITTELFDVINSNILDSAILTVKRILWDKTYTSGGEMIMFVGTVDVEFDRNILKLSCKSVLNSLNLKVPRRTYQEPCNSNLFDTQCGLIQSDYTYAGIASATSTDNFTLTDSDRHKVFKVAFDAGDDTASIGIGDTLTSPGKSGSVCVAIAYVTSSIGYIYYVEMTAGDISGGGQYEDDDVITGGGNTVTVNGTPLEDPSFYDMGELSMTSRVNDGNRRMIRGRTGDDAIQVAVALPYSIESGDTYNTYPGCDKRGDTCRDKFDNVDNFSGFLYIPNIEEVIM